MILLVPGTANRKRSKTRSQLLCQGSSATALGTGDGQSLWGPTVRALPRGLARVICLVYPELMYQITQAPSPSMGILRLVQKALSCWPPGLQQAPQGQCARN